MTAEQAQEAGIGRQRQTIAQRINAKRLKKGLPETNRFTITEIKRELGDDVKDIKLNEYFFLINGDIFTNLNFNLLC